MIPPKQIVEWLDKTARETPFGEINITIKLHDGAVSILEKTVTIREKPDRLSEVQHGPNKAMSRR